jgi:hypothetical protein
MKALIIDFNPKFKADIIINVNFFVENYYLLIFSTLLSCI